MPPVTRSLAPVPGNVKKRTSVGEAERLPAQPRKQKSKQEAMLQNVDVWLVEGIPHGVEAVRHPTTSNATINTFCIKIFAMRKTVDGNNFGFGSQAEQSFIAVLVHYCIVDNQFVHSVATE